MKYFVVKHYQGGYHIANSKDEIYYVSDKKWYPVASPIFNTWYYDMIAEIKDFKEENINKYLLTFKLMA